MATKRIYHVTNTTTNAVVLVRATNQAQAIRHASRSMFKARAASAEDLAAIVIAGGSVNVEDAKESEE